MDSQTDHRAQPYPDTFATGEVNTRFRDSQIITVDGTNGSVMEVT